MCGGIGRPVIPALGRQREEDFEFKVRLSFMVVRLCLRKKNQFGEVGQWVKALDTKPDLRSVQDPEVEREN